MPVGVALRFTTFAEMYNFGERHFYVRQVPQQDAASMQLRQRPVGRVVILQRCVLQQHEHIRTERFQFLPNIAIRKHDDVLWNRRLLVLVVVNMFAVSFFLEIADVGRAIDFAAD